MLPLWLLGFISDFHIVFVIHEDLPVEQVNTFSEAIDLMTAGGKWGARWYPFSE